MSRNAQHGWNVCIPHLVNALAMVARELNTAVETVAGRNPGIEIEWTVRRSEIVLVLVCVGLDDYEVDAPELYGADSYSAPIRSAILPAATSWLRAAGVLAAMRE